MKYVQAYDGDWIRPYMRNYRIKCCGCGLVHVLGFRIRGRNVEYRATRLCAVKKRRKKAANGS